MKEQVYTSVTIGYKNHCQLWSGMWLGDSKSLPGQKGQVICQCYFSGQVNVVWSSLNAHRPIKAVQLDQCQLVKHISKMCKFTEETAIS